MLETEAAVDVVDIEDKVHQPPPRHCGAEHRGPQPIFLIPLLLGAAESLSRIAPLDPHSPVGPPSLLARQALPKIPHSIARHPTSPENFSHLTFSTSSHQRPATSCLTLSCANIELNCKSSALLPTSIKTTGM